MTPQTRKAIEDIIAGDPWKVRAALRALLDSTPEEKEEKKGTRTLTQNNALHKDCALIAEKLNDAGKDMRLVLKQDVQIPWTTESVKEYIFKPIMKALYHKESTTELQKTGEIDKIHEVIMRELGEKHGIEWHDFPHDPTKTKENLSGARIGAHNNLSDESYPEMDETNSGNSF